MKLWINDGIVAAGSPASPGRRGVIRLSGESTLTILNRLGVLVPNGLPVASRSKTHLDLPTLGLVPATLLLWPNRYSYTGQPAAELHLIGSPPIVACVVHALIDAGARAARPGEFTLRAFLAGRLDLTQAEAVLGVIDADSPQVLEAALTQLAGNLSRPLQFARSTLLDLIADIEAGLDFADEDIEFVSDASIINRLSPIAELLSQMIDQLKLRGESHQRVRIVLQGLPNAGKSTLFNALIGEERAIVTPVAGTTRDAVRAIVEWQGQAIELIDTAGWDAESSGDGDPIVAALAQKQTANLIVDADIRVGCVDATAPTKASNFRKCEIAVATKLDALASDARWMRPSFAHQRWLAVSSRSGEGLADLRQSLVELARQVYPEDASGLMSTAARCRDSLSSALGAILAAIDLIGGQGGHELVAGELRLAIEAIGEVTGEVTTDDILDRVFQRFCIGK